MSCSAVNGFGTSDTQPRSSTGDVSSGIAAESDGSSSTAVDARSPTPCSASAARHAAPPALPTSSTTSAAPASVARAATPSGSVVHRSVTPGLTRRDSSASASRSAPYATTETFGTGCWCARRASCCAA
ncbi:hypothetical protein [Gemmatirosa kalamazoonensis]|uniref:hypothetical protein n=1 Tax=Gemmatirosa kalamazoonensis TaxID=861299 RepID=UPI00046CDF06|nr:hypothetical protein [Gemmatirosa kalamazoonensis]